MKSEKNGQKFKFITEWVSHIRSKLNFNSQMCQNKMMIDFPPGSKLDALSQKTQVSAVQETVIEAAGATEGFKNAPVRNASMQVSSLS